MSTDIAGSTIDTTTTIGAKKNGRIRKQTTHFNAEKPPSSDAGPSKKKESPKYTADQIKEHATLVIAKKTSLSHRKLEKLLGYAGSCTGSKIGYHKLNMEKLKAAAEPSVWNALVADACKKWLHIIHPDENEGMDVVSKEDLKLSAAIRKRKATVEAVNLMKEDPNLSYETAAANAAKRYKLTKLHPRTIKRFEQNPSRPTAGGQLAIYPQIEVELAYTVTFFRRFAVPVWRQDVKTLMNRMLLQIPFSRRPFGKKGVSAKWVRNFMKRHNLKCKNQEPNDLRRDFWMTASNMFQCFEELAKVAVKIGVAIVNPKYVSWESTPAEFPITWIPTEMWRVMEFDESACAPGMKSSEKPKNQGDKMVCPEDDDGTTIRDSLPSSHISLMVGLNFGLENIAVGVVYDKGENALIGEKLQTDDTGKPFTIPCAGGVEKEAFYGSNEKGSFDTPMLIEYVRYVISILPQGRSFTVSKKGLLFIDGCQTHVSELFVSFCHANHIEVVIKVPYASSKMQSMDAQGGHFVRFKQGMFVFYFFFFCAVF